MTIFPDYQEEFRRLARERAERPVSRKTSSIGRHLARPRAMLAIGLPVAVAVVVAATILASLGGRQAPLSGGQHASLGAQPIWLKRLRARFSVLPSRGSFVPTAIAHTLRGWGADRSEIDLAFAHRIDIRGGGLWVLPGQRNTCIVLARSGRPNRSNCLSTTTVERAGIHLSTSRETPYQPSNATVQIAGLVPDGTVAVLIYRTNGPVLSAAVQHNAFSASTQTQITSTLAIRNRPPFPRNAAGQTYGSTTVPATHDGRARRVGTQPDLVLVTGPSIHGPRLVTGFVRRTQLNAHICAHPKTPKQAIRCDHHNRPHTIPILAINGKTVIGTFQNGS